MQTDTKYIDSEQLCRLTGLTDQRHRQLAKEGWFPAPIKALYALIVTIQGLFRYYRESTGTKVRTILEEKEKKLRAERKIAELQLALMDKSSINSEKAEREWSNVVLTVKGKLLGLGNKIAPRLAICKSEAEFQALIDKEVTEIIEELSKPGNYGWK